MSDNVQNISEALDRLNPVQREAVTATLGPMLIVAGAGSGKTRVLTTRIALLLSQGVVPERILALTFTKKAADEMRSRIIALQGDTARRVCMGTFHSVFIRFLRPFAESLNFPQTFTVLDEDDSLATLRRCIAEVVGGSRPPKETWTKTQVLQYKEEDAAYKPKTIRNIISSCKNELITADAYVRNREFQERDRRANRPLTGQIFLRYRDTCHRMSMMDFDDLLLYTDMMMANNINVRNILAGSFDYILVDEYQDTNAAQYSILKRLTWLNKNICVVGDDSQSIYAFRGARIQNIINFQSDFPGCKVVKLVQNYRSTQYIVDAANRLIANNENRIPKDCFSTAEKGEKIHLVTSPETEKDESRFIAEKILAKRKAEGRRYSDFAVLYRTNAQSRSIEDALVKARIPYTVYSGTSFFSRLEVKDLMAYFKLAVNPNDNESFARVANKPARGFGDAAMRRLFAVASQWGVSLWQAATSPQIQLCGFTPRTLGALYEFLNAVGECIGYAQTRPAHEAATRISDLTGFYEAYNSESDDESRKRADNLRELIDSVRSYEEDCEAQNRDLQEAQREKPTLAGYLQNTMLLSNADTGEAGEDKVALMTVHCAKGLEFDTVFVAGMEKGLFPLEIEGDDFEEEEERRLFYVAMTRAKASLYLTKANSRIRFGKRKDTRPSKFLTEILSEEAKARMKSLN